jgi:hypothetical protein
MRGFEIAYDAAAMRGGVIFGTCSFQATVTPGAMARTTWTGSLKAIVSSITYAATGVYTVQMAPGFGFPPGNPPIIEPSNSCADVTSTNSFYVVQTGIATNSQANGVSFVLQCLSASTTPFAPPNTAGNRINFSLEGILETSNW